MSVCQNCKETVGSFNNNTFTFLVEILTLLGGTNRYFNFFERSFFYCLTLFWGGGQQNNLQYRHKCSKSNKLAALMKHTLA